MTTTTKQFHIGDILTAMTGRLVSPRGVDGMYDILNHLTGESLMTHQLPRASREAEPILRGRYPDLAAIEIPDFASASNKKAAVFAWLDATAAAHGETRAVDPLDTVDHTSIDPIAELKMIRPDAPIVIIRPEAEAR